MSVALNQPLPTIAWSKNAIVLQLKSDDYLTTTPAFSVNTVSFSGVVAPGASIGLSWNAGSAGMTAAAVPDDSGDQFPSGDGGAAYVSSLVDYFQSNYFIDPAFAVSADISGPNTKLVFTARVASTDYDITPAANQAVTTAGTSGSSKVNFMHHIEVWKYNPAGGDIKVYDANVALDEPKTGITTLDISESLHSFMALDSPSLTAGYWQACPKSCWQYYVKFAQFYGDDPAVKKLHKTGLYTVVYGGYSNLALQQITDRITYLAKYLMYNQALFHFQRWLETWPIDNLAVKTNQPQFFYFINNRDVADTLALRVDATFADGTNQTYFLPGGTLGAHKKIAIGCGYQQLGLPDLATTDNKISAYTITVVGDPDHTDRSLPKYFTINRDYEQYTRYLLYADSAGNFKTLRTNGQSQVSSDAEFDLSAFQPDVATLPEAGNYRNSNIKAVISDTLNTGYITVRDTYDALVELQYSKQVYRVFGQRLAPVVISSKKFEFSADGNNLSAMALEYRLAYDEDLHTADSSALSVPSLNHAQNALNDL